MMTNAPPPLVRLPVPAEPVMLLLTVSSETSVLEYIDSPLGAVTVMPRLAVIVIAALLEALSDPANVPPLSLIASAVGTAGAAPRNRSVDPAAGPTARMPLATSHLPLYPVLPALPAVTPEPI